MTTLLMLLCENGLMKTAKLKCVKEDAIKLLTNTFTSGYSENIFQNFAHWIDEFRSTRSRQSCWRIIVYVQLHSSPTSKLQKLLEESREMVYNLELATKAPLHRPNSSGLWWECNIFHAWKSTGLLPLMHKICSIFSHIYVLANTVCSFVWNVIFVTHITV